MKMLYFEPLNMRMKLKDWTMQLESHSNFPTCRGNVCVFDGKWMYEVTLGSSGVFQIGWATLSSQFDEQVCKFDRTIDKWSKSKKKQKGSNKNNA
jgi:Kip1 ubiquitination-promoting complex protein 1